MIKVKVAIGIWNKACVIQIPEETEENTGEIECFKEEMECYWNDWEFDLAPGVWWIEYSVLPHVCTHPECAHDDFESKIGKTTLIYVGVE